jgi:DNA-binding NarL/FixJ family response regulator
MEKKIRVAVVDKHPLFRDGVILALNSQLDAEVVGQGASAKDAIRIAEEIKPDVLVLDTDTLGHSMDAVDAILQHNPAIGILFFAVVIDEERVYAALRRGVRGYLLKGSNRAELAQTVRVLDEGKSYISPSLAAKLLMCSGPGRSSEAKTTGRLPHLTPREEQILSILVQGRSNKEIGNKLELSEKTIKHHLTNILQKLRVRNRVEAALLASNGLSHRLIAS